MTRPIVNRVKLLIIYRLINYERATTVFLSQTKYCVQVCDKTLELIASPSAWPRLEELCISHCVAVSDAGLIALGDSPKQLRCVNVDGISQLSDEYAAFLSILDHRLCLSSQI